MADPKTRVEPEVTLPDEDVAGPDAAERELSVEDLVPGLEDEIALSEDEEEGSADPVADQIAALEAQRDEMKDKWMRAVAEAENVRRRAERDRKDAATYGGTKLARDLLSVHDNLERALKAADDDMRAAAGSLIEGVELTQRELLNTFSKHKIDVVHPEAGEKFDPNLHQAMFEAPIPGAEPGTVIECMQDGFVIADRLLRPAMVGVARAMPEAPVAQEPAGETDTDSTAEDDTGSEGDKD
ncbi:MAG: nucleotide exchange factor GrpE [Pseudomonadota bacterium]